MHLTVLVLRIFAFTQQSGDNWKVDHSKKFLLFHKDYFKQTATQMKKVKRVTDVRLLFL